MKGICKIYFSYKRTRKVKIHTDLLRDLQFYAIKTLRHCTNYAHQAITIKPLKKYKIHYQHFNLKFKK